MPDLFNKLMSVTYNVSVFPVRESWLDIGRIEDYNKANTEYLEEIE